MEPKTDSDAPKFGPKIGAVVALKNQMRDLHHKEEEKKTNIVTQTTVEYSEASSLHGVQYIFESGKGLSGSRIFWLGLAIAAAILGIVWSVEVSYLLIKIQSWKILLEYYFTSGLCPLAREPYSELPSNHWLADFGY